VYDPLVPKGDERMMEGKRKEGRKERKKERRERLHLLSPMIPLRIYVCSCIKREKEMEKSSTIH
jgi:hypothetical protein